MAKAGLVFAGLVAAVGVGLAIKHAEAAEGNHNTDENANDNIDTGDDAITPSPDLPPLPQTPASGAQSPGLPTDPPSAGVTQGAGSADPGDTSFKPVLAPMLNPMNPDFVPNLILTAETVLPAPFDQMHLDGVPALQFHGLNDQGPEKVPFAEWLNYQHIVSDDSMPLYIWISVDDPRDWISAFWHIDAPGSSPPGHFIVYEVSNSPNRDWMIANITKRNP